MRECLSLSQQPNRSVDGIALTKTIARFEQLQSLHLYAVPIPLAELSNPKLRILRLNAVQDPVSHVDIRSLTKCIRHHPRLQELEVWARDLQHGSAVSILESARNLQNLVVFWIMALVFDGLGTQTKSSIWHRSPDERCDLTTLHGPKDGQNGMVYSADGCEQWLYVGNGRCTSKWHPIVGENVSPNTSVELRKAMDLVITKYYGLVELHDKVEKEKVGLLDGQ